MNKGKKILIVLMVLTLSLNVLVGCTDKEVEAIRKNTTVYSNSEYNIEARYASDWEINENGMQYIAAFLSPVENENDTFRENINIIIEDISSYDFNNETFNDYTLEQLINCIPDCEIISNKKFNLSKDTVYETVYVGNCNLLELKWKSIYFVKNKKAYTITFSADKNKYDKYIPYFTQFIQDFKY